MTRKIAEAAKSCSTQACTGCGVVGVKVWRPFQSWPDRLLCVACAHDDQNLDIAQFDIEKRDTIGWLVPAIPDGHGTWWGYTSVPDREVEEWKATPLRHEQEALQR